MKVVWLVAREKMFEVDWIEYLFSETQHDTVEDTSLDTIYVDAFLVFNHTIDYEAYLQGYEDEKVPYAAIHLSDETLGDTCHYIDHSSCKFVMRNYHHPIYSRNPKVMTFGLGYKSGFNRVSSDVIDLPWYHWCFAGAVHHQRRLDAIDAFTPLKPCLLFTSHDFNTNLLSQEDYKRMMDFSKFALCPIGQGNIDTFRIYEAMETGCIPVTLCNTPEQPYAPSYWHVLFNIPSNTEIPFVMGKTWTECCDKAGRILQSPNDYIQMREQVRAFWASVKKRYMEQVKAGVITLIYSLSP